jgi:hypothetical protein
MMIPIDSFVQGARAHESSTGAKWDEAPPDHVGRGLVSSGERIDVRRSEFGGSSRICAYEQGPAIAKIDESYRKENEAERHARHDSQPR